MLYFCDTGNFGDDLNGWIWKQLAPEVLAERPDRLFVGIGTILSPDIPAAPEKFVLGSGWSGEQVPRIDGKWRIYGVRGPLTAEGLGVESGKILSDPALLVRRCFKRPEDQGEYVGFMPHHRSVSMIDWKRLCEENGLLFINPEDPVETVLASIARCRIVLAEAMHGAIIADAFRIPWIPIRAYSHINEFKWRDWCGSLGMDYTPLRLPPLFGQGPGGLKALAHLWKRTLAPTPLGKEKWRRLPLRRSRSDEIRRFMDNLATRAGNREGTLSTNSRSNEAESRQLAALDRLRADWR